MKPEYGISTEIDLPFECALTRTKEALQQHGFDVAMETQVDGSRSTILGVNDLMTDTAFACDVIIYEDVCGGVTIAAVGNDDTRDRLDAVMDWLRPCAAR